jgi:xanthine/uracil permease
VFLTVWSVYVNLLLCIQRTYAMCYVVSVHMPRIGHSTPGFNWYGTERLIRKHLTSRGIATYVYSLRQNQLS